MSYDLMVFEKKTAPRNRKDFMRWYEKQTEWGENHGYDNPAVSSEKLRNWFMEMIVEFPTLSGPHAPTDGEIDDMADPAYLTDYSVGKEVIYAAFSWSLAERAFEKMRSLAKKHDVGFFDVSAENGEIAFWEKDVGGS
ncbi:MAG: hypothetical protein FWG65_01515 [Turicibacter sp.]|nr:hypothetical protein [Turicibacter sp.]